MGLHENQDVLLWLAPRHLVIVVKTDSAKSLRVRQGRVVQAELAGPDGCFDVCHGFGLYFYCSDVLEWFECWRGDLSSGCFSISIVRTPQRWRLKLGPRSQRLSILSQFDSMYECSKLRWESMNNFAFCSWRSNDALWCYDHCWHSDPLIDLLSPSTNKPLSVFFI